MHIIVIFICIFYLGYASYQFIFTFVQPNPRVMCFTIKSENLLANYFANSDEFKISFQKLKKLRQEIEEMFNNEIYVDITYDAVSKALWSNRDFYIKEKDFICLKKEVVEEFKNKEFLEDNFNWRIPEPIKEKYLKIFEICPNG